MTSRYTTAADVDDQRADPDPGELLGQFVDLERDEQRRRDDREVLAPALEQPEAGRLDELEARRRRAGRDATQRERVHRSTAMSCWIVATIDEFSSSSGTCRPGSRQRQVLVERLLHGAAVGRGTGTPRTRRAARSDRGPAVRPQQPEDDHVAQAAPAPYRSGRQRPARWPRGVAEHEVAAAQAAPRRADRGVWTCRDSRRVRARPARMSTWPRRPHERRFQSTAEGTGWVRYRSRTTDRARRYLSASLAIDRSSRRLAVRSPSGSPIVVVEIDGTCLLGRVPLVDLDPRFGRARSRRPRRSFRERPIRLFRRRPRSGFPALRSSGSGCILSTLPSRCARSSRRFARLGARYCLGEDSPHVARRVSLPPAAAFFHHQGAHHAYRLSRGLRRDARPRQGRRLRLPGDQRQLLADAERRAARLRRGRQRRHHPGLHRRRRVPVRPDRSRTWSPVRSRSPRTPHEVAKNYPINIALHTDHCPKDKLDGYVRPLLAISKERVARGEAPLFQSHMWDGSAVPLDREPADRQGAAGRGRRRAHRAGDRGRRRRWRGGRCRGRDRREALHHRRGRHGHGRGARPRRAGPLPGRADVRQRARRLQAGQRQAAPGDPRRDPGRGRPRSTARRSRSTWSSTAAPARCCRRSATRSTTAS